MSEEFTVEDLKEIKSWSGYYMCESGTEEDKPRVDAILKKIDSMIEKQEVETVEFNTGFISALAMFYGHRMAWGDEKVYQITKHDMRIYGASDHLYDIEYPKNLSAGLKQKIQEFVSDVFKVRLENISREDAENLFNRCRDLIIAIDEEYFIKKVIFKYD